MDLKIAVAAETDSPIEVETIPLRLSTRFEVELPVVHRTTNRQFVVLSNRLARAYTNVLRAADHPYFVVHVASGLRAPVPASIARHTIVTARQLADHLERTGFFDLKTGKPAVTKHRLRAALEEWNP